MRFALFLDLADAGFRKPKSARTRAKPGHESEGVRGASRERRKRGVPRRFPVRRDPRAVSSGATRLGELQSETAGFSKYPKRGNHFQLLVCELNNLLGRFPCTFSSCFRMRVSTCRNCIRSRDVSFRRQVFRENRRHAQFLQVVDPFGRRPAYYVCKGSPRATRRSLPRTESGEESKAHHARRITRRVPWRRAPCARAAWRSPPSPRAPGPWRGSPARAPTPCAAPRLAPSRARRARRRAL